MTCPRQIKPPEPYVSPYIRAALERMRKMDEDADDKCRIKQREERPMP